MKFYNRQHRHYCGIDLHVKTMYVCILDATGQVLVHRNAKSTPEAFLGGVVPRRSRRRHRGWLDRVTVGAAIPD
jgi:predicted NBD/HSP70 family sugar kinase